MKSLLSVSDTYPMLSPPSRGAWIEIPEVKAKYDKGRSPPSRGAWIEIAREVDFVSRFAVAPLAGAWIEIIVSADRWPRL